MKTISRKRTIEILRHHGWTTTQPTTTGRINGGPLIWLPGTSFDDEVGIKDRYTVRELAEWLGY